MSASVSVPSAAKSGMRLARIAAVSLLALSAAGCLKRGGPEVTGSIGKPAATSESGWRQQTEYWGKRYEADPNDRTVAMNYASALRALEQAPQAVAVLEKAAIRNPRDPELLAAYGRALIDVGRFKQASEVLARAQRPEQPDWRILSAQGTAADQMGDQATAQKFYEAALKIQPDDPAVMSNLGLSYALSKKLPEAETILRRAAQNPRADQRVRQNLALVLGLRGKFDDAERVVRQDLPEADAKANVAYLRQFVTQQNTWSAMRKLDGPKTRPNTARTAEADVPGTH